MVYIIIAIITLAIGFILGLRSKAQAKINRRDSIRQGNVHVKNVDGMPGHRNAPPPPAPPKSRIIREGEIPAPPVEKIVHIKPGTTYKYDTYVSVNKCSNCNAIGRQLDMWDHNPCPKCGGRVKTSGAAKWGEVDGVKQWIKSKI